MTQYHSETKDKNAKGKKEYNVYYMLVNILDVTTKALWSLILIKVMVEGFKMSAYSDSKLPPNDFKDLWLVVTFVSWAIWFWMGSTFLELLVKTAACNKKKGWEWNPTGRLQDKKK